MSEDTGVTITLSQIYAEVQTTHNEVRDMRADLRAALNATEDHESRLRELEKNNPGDHEPRLRSVERSVWKASGAAGVLGGGGALAVSALVRVLTGG